MHNAISQIHTFLFTSGIAIMLCALLIRFLSETMMIEWIMSAKCVPTIKSILIMIFHALYGVVWFWLNHSFFANCENIDIACHNSVNILPWAHPRKLILGYSLSGIILRWRMSPCDFLSVNQSNHSLTKTCHLITSAFISYFYSKSGDNRHF